MRRCENCGHHLVHREEWYCCESCGLVEEPEHFFPFKEKKQEEQGSAQEEEKEEVAVDVAAD